MPEIDPHYRDAAAAGTLSVQRCPVCGRLRFPPASLCPNCLTPSDEWVPVSGRGVVWSWIRLHRQYFADKRRVPPYTVVIVELEEGLRLVSGLVGDESGLRVGMPVEAVFVDEGQGVLPWFRAVEEAA